MEITKKLHVTQMFWLIFIGMVYSLERELTEKELNVYFNIDQQTLKSSVSARVSLQDKLLSYNRNHIGMILSVKANEKFYVDFAKVPEWENATLVISYIECQNTNDETLLLDIENTGCIAENRTKEALNRLFPPFKFGFYNISNLHLLKNSKLARSFLDHQISTINRELEETYLTFEQDGIEITHFGDLIFWQNFTFLWKSKKSSGDFSLIEMQMLLNSILKNELFFQEHKHLSESFFPKINIDTKFFLQNKNFLLNASHVARQIVQDRISEFHLNQEYRASIALEQNGQLFAAVQDIKNWENVTMLIQKHETCCGKLMSEFLQFLKGTSLFFLMNDDLSKKFNEPIICRRFEKELKLAPPGTFFTIIGDVVFSPNQCFINGYVNVHRVILKDQMEGLNAQLFFYQSIIRLNLEARKSVFWVINKYFSSKNIFYYLTNCDGDPTQSESIPCDWREKSELEKFVFSEYYNTGVTGIFYPKSLADLDFSRFKRNTFLEFIRKFSSISPSLIDVLHKDSLKALSIFLTTSIGKLEYTGPKNEVLSIFQQLTNVDVKILRKEKVCFFVAGYTVNCFYKISSPTYEKRFLRNW